jgi:hypothetical protein
VLILFIFFAPGKEKNIVVLDPVFLLSFPGLKMINNLQCIVAELFKEYKSNFG